MSTVSPASEGTFGSIFELQGLLDSLMSAGASAMVRLEGDKGLGLIWVRDGLIVEARHQGLSGQTALSAVLAIPNGQYWVQSGRTENTASIRQGNRQLLSELVQQSAEWVRLRDALPPLSSKLILRRDALYEATSELTPLDIKILKAAKGGLPIFLLGPELAISDVVLFRRLTHLLRLDLVSLDQAAVFPPSKGAEKTFEQNQEPRQASSDRPSSGYSFRGSGLTEAVTLTSSSRPPLKKSGHPRLFAPSETPPPVIPKAAALPTDVERALPPKNSEPPRARTVGASRIIETTGELQPRGEPRTGPSEDTFVAASDYAELGDSGRPAVPSTARQFHTDPPVTPVQFGSSYPKPLEAVSLLERRDPIVAQEPFGSAGVLSGNQAVALGGGMRAQEVKGPILSAGRSANEPRPRWVRRQEPVGQNSEVKRSDAHELLARMSTAKVSGAYRAVSFLALAVGLLALLPGLIRGEPLFLGVGAVALCFHLAVLIGFLVRLYRALAPSTRALLPQQVMLPLLVPGYGLYWWVRLWVGLVRAIDEVAQKTRVSVALPNERLAWVTALLPVIGAPFAWVFMGQLAAAWSVLARAAEMRQSRSSLFPPEPQPEPQR